MTKKKPGQGRTVGALNRATAALEAAQDYVATLAPEHLADAIATIQDVKYRLGLVESALAAALGEREGVIQGNLPDGRQFTLKRTQDRKEWDHEDWKRDARRVLVQQALEVNGVGRLIQFVTPHTGEVMNLDLAHMLQVAITEAQEVHGSTAPRSTSLKRLGLYASDYCTSSPGGWRLNAIRPKPKPTTDTKES